MFLHPNRGPGFTFHRFEVGFVGIRGYHVLALFLGGKGKDFLAGFIFLKLAHNGVDQISLDFRSQLARKMHRLGRISYKVLIYYGIRDSNQRRFRRAHWPAQPAMIGYTL